MDELTYEQVVELERNIEVKNQAKKIMNDFYNNVKLNIKDYSGNGRFRLWHDQHNDIYVDLKDDKFYFRCRFLHESYDIEMTFNGIFQALKNEDRGIDHLKPLVKC
ncbi:MAG: hypothetical protein IPJ03_15895 [Ignavibacteriales bacterium]|nr:hypothetical protein [Ignavibacteriales bacterium]